MSIYMGYIVCTTPPTVFLLIVMKLCIYFFMVASQIDFSCFFCFAIFFTLLIMFPNFLLKDSGLLTICLPLANFVFC